TSKWARPRATCCMRSFRPVRAATRAVQKFGRQAGFGNKSLSAELLPFVWPRAAAVERSGNTGFRPRPWAEPLAQAELDLLADTDAVVDVPAHIGLERVPVRRGGPMYIVTERLHVLDVDDRAVLVDPGNGQRQVCVVHPVALGGGMVVHEQHAAV